MIFFLNRGSLEIISTVSLNGSDTEYCTEIETTAENEFLLILNVLKIE